MPVVQADLLYSHLELSRFAQAALTAAGTPPADAALTTDNLIQANLRGVDTHGVTRVLVPYVRRIQKGLIRADADIQVLRERPSTALLDANGGIGQVAAARAMQMAIEKASVTGAGWIQVRRTNHFGAAAYFAEMAADQDMIGLVATNGPAAVAPWGGRTPILSTNPLAFAIPAGSHPPVVLDMATTVVARGRIALYAKQGKEMPEGWALDEEGRPTTDAAAALRGSLLPMAGYKGYGLSLVIDALSGVLSGAGYGLHVGGYLVEYGKPPHDVGSLFAAVAVDSFMDVPEFRARMDEALREIKESPRAPGVERIYAPGEIEHETKLRRLTEGIPLPSEVVRDFEQLAEELGIEAPRPLSGDQGI